MQAPGQTSNRLDNCISRRPSIGSAPRAQKSPRRKRSQDASSNDRHGGAGDCSCRRQSTPEGHCGAAIGRHRDEAGGRVRGRGDMGRAMPASSTRCKPVAASLSGRQRATRGPAGNMPLWVRRRRKRHGARVQDFIKPGMHTQMRPGTPAQIEPVVLVYAGGALPPWRISLRSLRSAVSSEDIADGYSAKPMGVIQWQSENTNLSTCESGCRRVIVALIAASTPHPECLTESRQSVRRNPRLRRVKIPCSQPVSPKTQRSTW